MDNPGSPGAQSPTNLTPNPGTIGLAETRLAMTLEWFVDVGLVEQCCKPVSWANIIKMLWSANAAPYQKGVSVVEMVVQRTDILPSERFVTTHLTMGNGTCQMGCAPCCFADAT
jgi:hypothetical protein